MNNMPHLPDFKQNFVFLINRKNGLRFGRFGFSLLAFLFHWIPAILRSDYYNAACIVGVDACIYMVTHMVLQLVFNVDPSSAMNITYMVGAVLWGSIYNYMFIRRMINRDFRPVDQNSQLVLKNHHIDVELTDMTEDELNSFHK